MIISVNCSGNKQKNAQIQDQPHKTDENHFLNKIQQLQNGKIDSIKLKFARTITINPIDANASEITKEESEKKEIILDDYQPITQKNILKADGKYILMLLYNKNSEEIRAATFLANGKPVETILLFFQTGNNEFKIGRIYSLKNDKAYFYNAIKNEFKFTDYRYDTEWIEYPVNGKEVETYKFDYTVQIDNNGHYKLVR